MDNLLMRSCLFTPASNRKYIEKSLHAGADVVILDLEDSVPPDRRQEARDNIKEFALNGSFANTRVFVRINEIDSKDFCEDVLQLILSEIYGFMPSKICSAFDIKFLDRLLVMLEKKRGITDGHFKLAPLIETTKALACVDKIAQASDRLIALCLGGEDYTNDIGSIYTYQESALEVPRALVVNAARANNLLPIDTPYIDYHDKVGFGNVESLAYHNGFAGCLLINPSQIEIANKVFSPNESMIKYSMQIIEAVNNARDCGSEIATLDGKMIGPPMRKRAETVINQMKLLKKG